MDNLGVKIKIRIMKKILYILFVMLCMASCDDFLFETRTYEVNYTVCYPDTIITQTDTVSSNCAMSVWNNMNDPVRTSSHRGTNYIVVGNNSYSNTTCPIRVNNYRRLK